MATLGGGPSGGGALPAAAVEGADCGASARAKRTGAGEEGAPGGKQPKKAGKSKGEGEGAGDGAEGTGEDAEGAGTGEGAEGTATPRTPKPQTAPDKELAAFFTKAGQLKTRMLGVQAQAKDLMNLIESDSKWAWANQPLVLYIYLYTYLYMTAFRYLRICSCICLPIYLFALGVVSTPGDPIAEQFLYLRVIYLST